MVESLVLEEESVDSEELGGVSLSEVKQLAREGNY